jgi:hypothetical protein
MAERARSINPAPPVVEVRLMKPFGLAAAAAGLALVASPLLAQQAAKAPPAAGAPASAVRPEALDALKKMSAYLATLKELQLTSKTSLDVVTVKGERITLDGVANYRVRRPDGFVINVASDSKDRTFYYDGKHFTVYAPELGYYATAPAPPTIRETLDALEARFGIQLPLEDLFRWNDPTNNPAENLTSGFYVGTATLDGVETDHYAFRQPKVDWQIWIQQGPRPLPKKVVIVDQVDPANPAYVARLSWNTNPTITPADFTFHPGKNAKLIKLSEAR